MSQLLMVDGRGTVRKIEAIAGHLVGFCSIAAVDDLESDFNLVQIGPLRAWASWRGAN